MLYKFTYFELSHINALILYFIVGVIIIGLPFFIRDLEKTIYTKCIGYFIIILKSFDIFYRVYFEKHHIKDVWPLHLCNIAVILAGIYLITKKNIIFNLVYFYYTGAILAVILPGLDYLYTKTYVYIFIGTHMLEIIAVLYALIHLDARVTKKGLKLSLGVYLIISILIRLLNNTIGTNYMFLNDYILPAVSFIKPLNLYAILLTALFMLSMLITYIPFMYSDNDEIEEKIIG
ncbi:YwaF family protein [Oceanivirga salmonicida]|uniref:YwaF family protein n=1 Tax=Oceanivirga salmonicida TaxID=1769291 RepID=UPI0008336376|nr:TIGR02206 family membrane protein [Oceanivirga salmonicida]